MTCLSVSLTGSTLQSVSVESIYSVVDAHPRDIIVLYGAVVGREGGRGDEFGEGDGDDDVLDDFATRCLRANHNIDSSSVRAESDLGLDVDG